MKQKIIIIAGPSGVGKATIEKELFKINDLKLCFSCSATTRSPRHGEQDGREYYFLSNSSFDQKIVKNEFLEWNEHFNNKYGTLKTEINRILQSGYTPLVEVDVEGVKNIIKYASDKYELVTIFIMPPSVTELERRIRYRNTENEEQLKVRLERYYKEIDAQKIFKYIIINNDISETVTQIVKIIKGS